MQKLKGKQAKTSNSVLSNEEVMTLLLKKLDFQFTSDEIVTVIDSYTEILKSILINNREIEINGIGKIRLSLWAIRPLSANFIAKKFPNKTPIGKITKFIISPYLKRLLFNSSRKAITLEEIKDAE